MKCITFILSIYIFALNLVPCQDYVVVSDETKIEISEVLNNDHQHQENDVCSPFCICQCCHINATKFKTISLKADIAIITTQDFFFLNGTEKDFNTSILQPPKA